jgi:hypothetical protein
MTETKQLFDWCGLNWSSQNYKPKDQVCVISKINDLYDSKKKKRWSTDYFKRRKLKSFTDMQLHADNDLPNISYSYSAFLKFIFFL